MLKFQSILLLSFYCLSVCSKGIPVPKGKYHVGITQHVLNHTTSPDVTAPSGTGTSILLTFFYPTLQRPRGTRQYLTPQIAELFEPVASYPPGTLGNLTSNLQFDAPPIPAKAGHYKYPTLVFQPGGTGPPSEVYQILLPELASHGYVIAAIDHPYEQPFLQYPYGGPGILGLPLDVQLNETFVQGIYDFRLTDSDAFLDFFPKFVQKRGLPFNTTHYGLFGHSIGGASAAGILAASRNPKTKSKYSHVNILGAINYDGSFFNEQASKKSRVADVHAPVLLMGSEVHYDFTIDPTWKSFTRAQTGWWREVIVNGSQHLDYSDIAFWKELTPKGRSTTPSVGPISDKRMELIKAAYTRAFFDYVSFGTEPTILNGPNAAFPEVNYIGGANATVKYPG